VARAHARSYCSTSPLNSTTTLISLLGNFKFLYRRSHSGYFSLVPSQPCFSAVSGTIPSGGKPRCFSKKRRAHTLPPPSLTLYYIRQIPQGTTTSRTLSRFVGGLCARDKNNCHLLRLECLVFLSLHLPSNSKFHFGFRNGR
jgi:hypothetical protein